MSRLLKLTAVEEKVGYKRAKIYQMIKEGQFPAPEKIGRSSRWHEEAVNDWIDNKGWKKAANG